MAFLKSRPPYILKPHGEGPIRFTVSAMARSDLSFSTLVQTLGEKNQKQIKETTSGIRNVRPKHVHALMISSHMPETGSKYNQQERTAIICTRWPLSPAQLLSLA